MMPTKRRDWRSILVRTGIGTILFVAGIWFIPHRWCARDASQWYHGNAGQQQKLAGEVERWVRLELGRGHFSPGRRQFNGEWLFGTYAMAAMGFGQTALAHPEWRARHAELMSLCIERTQSPDRKSTRLNSSHVSESR